MSRKSYDLVILFKLAVLPSSKICEIFQNAGGCFCKSSLQGIKIIEMQKIQIKVVL